MKYVGKLYARIGDIHVPIEFDTGKEVEAKHVDDMHEMLTWIYENVNADNITITDTGGAGQNPDFDESDVIQNMLKIEKLLKQVGHD
jgi:hypothetical protein